MNARFEKYLKVLAGASQSEIEQALAELHKTFARLTQDEQKYANIFLHDVERGDVTPDAEKTLRDYITEYQEKAQSDRVHRVAEAFGLDEGLLRDMMALRLTEDNLNEFGRFSRLQATVDKVKARAFLERQRGESLSPKDVSIQVDAVLRRFFLESGFDI
jgi:type I restriction enzyme R subunit